MGSSPVAVRFALSVLVVFSMLLPAASAAQGCSQCRDNVSQTAPGVQASYRTAILLMLGAVAVFTGGTVLLLRKLK